MPITFEEYKKLRQEGLSSEEIRTQIYPEKKRGLIRGVGKFLGMEEFGRGIGLAAFRLTPEYKDLEKQLQEGTITPEEFQDITTGGLKNREVIGSAVQTGLSVVGLRGGLPAQIGARPILGKVAAGAVTGAAFGGAESGKRGEGVLKGAATGAVVGGVVGGLLGVAARAFEKVGNKEASNYLLKRTLKQTPKDIALEKSGARPVLAEQLRKLGFKGSEEKIVEVSATNLAKLEKQVSETVLRNKNTNIDTIQAVRALDNIVAQKRNVFGQKGVEKINEFKRVLLGKGDKISLPEVHKYVRDIYKELGEAAFENQVKDVGRVTLRTMASAMRRAMGQANKPLDNLIKQEQTYIRIIKNLERQLNRRGRLNILGLSDSILAASGIATGEPITGIGAGLVKRAIESAQFKTRAAVRLDQIGNIINKIPTDTAGKISKTALFNALKNIQP